MKPSCPVGPVTPAIPVGPVKPSCPVAPVAPIGIGPNAIISITVVSYCVPNSAYNGKLPPMSDV